MFPLPNLRYSRRILGLTQQTIVAGSHEEENGNRKAEQQGDTLLAEPRTKAKRPPFYKVVMLNDDYTPMDFVVHVLKSIFRRPHEEAISIMLDIHHQGAGVCGIYSRDVAETLADLVTEAAREHEHPLQCTLEQD